MPMDMCHMLLGRPWKYDRNVFHDRDKNCYRFVMYRIKHTLVPMKQENTIQPSGTKSFLIGGNEFLRQIEGNENMLEEFSDIVVDDLPDKLPPKQNISHHIVFIPGVSLPNRVSYQMSSKENEENRKHVQELFDEGLIWESLSPCVVSTILAPKKGGEWSMCTDSWVINKITIRYRFPLP
eukprot:PITA_33093